MLGTIFVGLSILLQAQAAPARDLEARERIGSIAGRVTAAGTDQPLPRLVVTLARPARPPEHQTFTGADGRYQFEGLPAGPYVITAGPDEHRSTYLRQRFGEQAPASFFEAALMPGLSLAPGEARDGVDIAVSRALAISGRVLDPRDEPMANVDVVVTRPDGGNVLIPAAPTDDLGAYRAYGLPPGRYRVCAAAQDSFNDQATDGARFVRTCHPAAVVEGASGDVVLHASDVDGIDIRVQRLGTFSVSGTIVDASGAAVTGASVGVSPSDSSASSSSTRSQDGQFVLNGLLPGRYVVSGSVGGSWPGDPNPPSREREIGFARVEVAGADAGGVMLTLSKPVNVQGAVVFDGENAPKSERLRMVVQTQTTDRTIARTLSRPPFSPVDDSLRFDLKDVYRLPLLVRVHNLPEGWVVAAVRYGGRDVTHVPMDFVAASADRLEVVLTNRVARLAVRVVDPAGLPTASAWIVAVPADPAAWSAPLPFLAAPPDAEGVRKIGAILPGAYRIAALSTADYQIFMRDPSRLDALAPLGTLVTILEGDERTVDVRVISMPAR